MFFPHFVYYCSRGSKKLNGSVSLSLYILVNIKQSIFYYISLKFYMCDTFASVKLTYDTFTFFIDDVLFLML
jgi:hypothetical protein